MGKVLENCKVSFCSVTKPDGHKNGKHMIAVIVDKDTKKKLLKEAKGVWEDNKSGKATTPTHDAKDWFVKDDNGDIIFFLTAKANAKYPINFSQGDDCDYSEDDFDIIGKGSRVDVEYGMYHYTNDGKEGLGRAINSIKLLDLVKYEGGSAMEGKALKKGKKSKDKEDNESKSLPKDEKKKDKKSKKDKKKKKGKE